MAKRPFKPTFLYIKQHTITGKLYFGKYSGKRFDRYFGSGKYWTNHTNKHGKEHVVNLWYCLFYDEQDCKEFALNFSKQQNIVESDKWANVIVEDGTSDTWEHVNSAGKNIYGKNGDKDHGGRNLIHGWNRIRTQEEFDKISDTFKKKYENGYVNPFKGRTHSDETLNKLRGHDRQTGEKNSQFGTVWMCHDIFDPIKINKNDIVDYIDQGWFKGRSFKFVKSRIIKQKPINIDKIDLVKAEAENTFAMFLNGNYKSVRDFARNEYNKSHVYLTKIWKKYIPEYSNVKQGKAFNAPVVER